MTGVVGLDLSLVSTGYAVRSEAVGFRSEVIESNPRAGKRQGGETVRFESEDDRLAFIRDEISDRLIMLTAHRRSLDLGPPLVVVEGLAFSSRDGSASTRAGLHFLVRAMLRELPTPCPFVVIEPAKVKRFATGKGNAKKEQMVSAVTMRTKREYRTSDEVDAVALLAIGCHLAGDPYKPLGDLPQTHLAALAGLKLPS